MIKGKVYTIPVTNDLKTIDPNLGSASDSQATTNTDTFTPPVQVTPIPTKVVAQQVLSDSLDTQRRKILKNYTLGASGAIQVGQYTTGVSGDIRITPDGIAARNKDGNSTFTLDGITGDATFLGTVVANDVAIIDKDGLVSLANFSSTSAILSNTNQEITAVSPNFNDVTDSSLTFSLARSSVVYLTASVVLYSYVTDGITITSIVYIDVDGDSVGIPVYIESPNLWSTCHTFSLTIRTAGSHTVKLKACNYRPNGGTAETYIGAFGMYYLILGN